MGWSERGRGVFKRGVFRSYCLGDVRARDLSSVGIFYSTAEVDGKDCKRDHLFIVGGWRV